MSDAVRRALRTFIQVFLGLYLARLIGWLGQLSEWAGCREMGMTDCSFPEVSVLGYGLVVAGSSAMVAIISFVQNALEDNTKLPALFKGSRTTKWDPPTPGTGRSM